MKYTIVFMFLLTANPLQADQGNWTVHTVSMHFSNDEELNNINPGVAYDLFEYMRIGGVVNSYKRLSLYAVGIIPITHRLRVGVGTVNGYDNGPQPMAAIEYDILPDLSILWFGKAINMELKF